MGTQENELRSWENIVRIAREKGEIRSEMTDAQVAQFFIYTNDGVGVRLILTNNMSHMKDALSSLYDGFYKQLKA
jgi:hypothetical protein